MMPADGKVNLQSLSDLKNATDDQIVRILSARGYKQIFTLIDVRLAIGFLSVVVAAAAGGYDYYVGFEAAKLYTTIGVAVYFALNALLTIWVTAVEKGTVFEGTKAGAKISVRSSTKKNVPAYEIRVSDKRSSKSVDAKKQFTEFFNKDGNIVSKPLELWLDDLISTVAADSGQDSTAKKDK